MERKPIQQLSQSLINRIAAGEVIERPASVVKELVDNAIDAGATQIIVEILDGGRELIRVIDDGAGIPADELPLAFAPHATSKLRSDEDLTSIQTMGFRGEALASIGSVSHARILSRVASSDAAYELTNHGGEIGVAQASAGNVGTTIDIRNLFYNVPARRKFLKGTQTEFGHIADMVLRLALAQPQIAFRVLHNSRVVREYPATAPDERLLCAWPDEFREQRLGLKTRDAEIRITGIVGLPELASPTAKYQHLYINGRPIRDKFIQHALREAYRGLTEPGRYPAAILLIDMPPADVDVNVHPTKSEVRFRDSGRIHGLVMSAIREVLLGSDLTPRAVPTAGDNFTIAERETMQQRLAAFFRAGSEGQPMPAMPSMPPTGGSSSWHERQHASTFELQGQSTQNAFAYVPPLPRDFGAGVSSASSENTHPSPPPQVGAGTDVGGSAATSSPNIGAPLRPASALQLHNSYLVAQSDEGMLIIDQHALHERILYEELLAKVTAGPLESQRMLIPMTIAASSRQIDLLEQIKPLLAKLGVEAEAFGPETVAIQAFPSFLDRLDPGAFVQELLERGEQELLDLHEEELLHEVLDMMSCKAAIKAGDPLTPQEIEALLARRELVERSSNCPHGRPTTLRLSIRDLEKQFKRTGF